MAAPTPVSSLVHSSTLVTAGVYLLVRFSPRFSAQQRVFVLLIGMLTMLMARVRALYELDIKKIVALSTLSQLGIMFTGLGLHLTSLAMAHLITHAFFKALLFISVGQLIHLSVDFQDLRNIGIAHSTRPTLSMAVLANLSLAGTPFISGFFSKDAIIELINSNDIVIALWGLLYLSVAATAAYCLRFTALIALNPINSSKSGSSLDTDRTMHLAISILWPLAALAGRWLIWELVLPPVFFAVPSVVKVAPLALVASGAIVLMAGPMTKRPLS